VRGGGRRFAILLAAAVLVAAGCATAASPGSSPSKTISPSGLLPPSRGPVSPVVGTVASVDPPAPVPTASPKASAKPAKSASPAVSPSAAPVLGFTLVTTGGDTLTFTIGELDNEEDFPPSDLYGRISTEDPIRVYFEVDGDTLLVYHIEDAT
jgi:hypothetical protein